MSNSAREYEIFNARRDVLIGCLVEAQQLFDHLNESSKAKGSKQLEEQLRSERFRVLVIGEFKRGKSTFINSLLREEVLPAFSTPCTAVINEIKWSESRSATLHFNEDLPKRLPDHLPESVIKHISDSSETQVPPLEIETEDLEEFVVIPDPTKNQAASVAESPYSKVEIFWPLELCKNGVEIVDSPGLNEHGTRTRVTTHYLQHVDAVLFVMSCQALASETELSVVENQIRSSGHEEIFFIANRFDQVRLKERERLVAFGNSKLAPLTELGERGVFFVSALDALEGYLEGDEERIQRSGIPGLERALEDFLANDRGKIKLLRTVRTLVRSLRESRTNTIPGQLAMLEKDVEYLQDAFDRVKPELDQVEERRRQIIDWSNRKRDQLRRDVEHLAVSQFREAASKISDWAKQMETEAKFKVIALSTKPQVERIAAEVAEHMNDKLQGEFNRWQQEVLRPKYEEWFSEFEERVSADLNQLQLKLDDITASLTGITQVATTESLAQEISPLERILSAAGGFFIGGVGSAAIGATMGGKEMLKSLGPQIALIVGAIMLGIMNPIAWIAIMVSAATVQGWLKQNAMTSTIKNKTAEEIAKKLSEASHENARAIAEGIHENTGKLVAELDLGMMAEIQAKREQVEAALAQLKKGDTSTKKRMQELKSYGDDIERIDNKISDLLMELVES